MMNSVVVASARRTSIGDFCGEFSEVSAPELGSAAIESVISDANIDASEINETIMAACSPPDWGRHQRDKRPSERGFRIPFLRRP